MTEDIPERNETMKPKQKIWTGNKGKSFRRISGLSLTQLSFVLKYTTVTFLYFFFYKPQQHIHTLINTHAHRPREVGNFSLGLILFTGDVIDFLFRER